MTNRLERYSITTLPQGFILKAPRNFSIPPTLSYYPSIEAAQQSLAHRARVLRTIANANVGISLIGVISAMVGIFDLFQNAALDTVAEVGGVTAMTAAFLAATPVLFNAFSRTREEQQVIENFKQAQDTKAIS